MKSSDLYSYQRRWNYTVTCGHVQRCLLVYFLLLKNKMVVMVATLTPYAADKGKHSVMQPAGSSPVQYHWVSEVKWFWLT